MVKTLMGSDNDPLYAVIRLDHPEGWVPPNAFEQRVYQMPHTGYVHNRDKKMILGKIIKAYLNTPSWEWIHSGRDFCIDHEEQLYLSTMFFNYFVPTDAEIHTCPHMVISE